MAQWVAAGKRLAIFSSGSREAATLEQCWEVNLVTFQNGNLILDDFFWIHPFGQDPPPNGCVTLTANDGNFIKHEMISSLETNFGAPWAP